MITDAQLYLAIGLPTLAVLASLTVSLVQMSGIRGDIREIRNSLEIITGRLQAHPLGGNNQDPPSRR